MHIFICNVQCITGECEVYLDLLDLESFKDMGIYC